MAYARDLIIFHVLFLSPSLHLSLCSFCPPSRHTVKIIILHYSVERQQWLADRPTDRPAGMRATAVDPAAGRCGSHNAEACAAVPSDNTALCL